MFKAQSSSCILPEILKQHKRTRTYHTNSPTRRRVIFTGGCGSIREVFIQIFHACAKSAMSRSHADVACNLLTAAPLIRWLGVRRDSSPQNIVQQRGINSDNYDDDVLIRITRQWPMLRSRTRSTNLSSNQNALLCTELRYEAIDGGVCSHT